MGTQHQTRESAQSQQAPGLGIRAATEHASPDLGKRQLWRGLRAASSATLPGTRKEPAGKLRLPQTKSEGCSAKVHGITHQRTGFPAGTQVAFTLEVGTLPTEAPSRKVLLWGRVDRWTSSSRGRGGPPSQPGAPGGSARSRPVGQPPPRGAQLQPARRALLARSHPARPRPVLVAAPGLPPRPRASAGGRAARRGRRRPHPGLACGGAERAAAAGPGPHLQPLPARPPQSAHACGRAFIAAAGAPRPHSAQPGGPYSGGAPGIWLLSVSLLCRSRLVCLHVAPAGLVRSCTPIWVGLGLQPGRRLQARGAPAQGQWSLGLLAR